MTALRSMILAAVAGLALAGCAKSVKAPTTPRTCYYAAEQKDGTWQFFKRETVGSYQGQFIFLQDEGVFFARKFDGVRYLALRRYQGRLIMPGAIQQGP